MLSRGHQLAVSALLLQRRSLSVGLDDVHTPIALILQGKCPARKGAHIPPCTCAASTVIPSAEGLRPLPQRPRPLTALGHHALLRLRCLSLAHGAVRGAHLDHAMPLLHAHPAGGAALVPLAPLGRQAAAGSWGVRWRRVSSPSPRPRACPTPGPHSQHSSLTVHFSVSSVGSVHTEPSSGNCFTYLSRDRMPAPQEMLQGDQVIHSDMVHVEPSATGSGHCSRGGTQLGLAPLTELAPPRAEITRSAGMQGNLGN